MYQWANQLNLRIRLERNRKIENLTPKRFIYVVVSTLQSIEDKRRGFKGHTLWNTISKTLALCKCEPWLPNILSVWGWITLEFGVSKKSQHWGPRTKWGVSYVEVSQTREFVHPKRAVWKIHSAHLFSHCLEQVCRAAETREILPKQHFRLLHALICFHLEVGSTQMTSWPGALTSKMDDHVKTWVSDWSKEHDIEIGEQFCFTRRAVPP